MSSPQGDVILSCTDCDALVVLPPVTPPEGATGPWVSIENMDDWTTPPLRCPACSTTANGRTADL